MKISKRTVFSFLAALLWIPTTAQVGETLFRENCSACHSIGSGRLVGPDLMGVHIKRSEDWIIRFVQSSQTFIQSGDPDAKEIFQAFNGIVMPDQPLSVDEVKSVIGHIAGLTPVDWVVSTAETDTTASTPVQPDFTARFSEQEIDAFAAEGEVLFAGSRRLENGGPSCMSCHNVQHRGIVGGFFGIELTDAYSRLGGGAAVKAIVSNPPFPVMKAAYRNSPVTDREAQSLVMFLKRLDDHRFDQYIPARATLLLYSGGTGLIIFLLLIALIWSSRKKRSVKHDILKRQLAST